MKCFTKYRTQFQPFFINLYYNPDHLRFIPGGTYKAATKGNDPVCIPLNVCKGTGYVCPEQSICKDGKCIGKEGYNCKCREAFAFVY